MKEYKDAYIKIIASELHKRYCKKVHKIRDHKPGLLFCSFDGNPMGNGPTSWSDVDKKFWFDEAEFVLELIQKQIVEYW